MLFYDLFFYKFIVHLSPACEGITTSKVYSPSQAPFSITLLFIIHHISLSWGTKKITITAITFYPSSLRVGPKSSPSGPISVKSGAGAAGYRLNPHQVCGQCRVRMGSLSQGGHQQRQLLLSIPLLPAPTMLLGQVYPFLLGQGRSAQSQGRQPRRVSATCCMRSPRSPVVRLRHHCPRLAITLLSVADSMQPGTEKWKIIWPATLKWRGLQRLITTSLFIHSLYLEQESSVLGLSPAFTLKII